MSVCAQILCGGCVEVLDDVSRSQSVGSDLIVPVAGPVVFLSEDRQHLNMCDQIIPTTVIEMNPQVRRLYTIFQQLQSIPFP